MSGVPDSITPLVDWEANVTGKAVSIVHWGHFWMSGRSSYQAWNDTRINNARSHGSIPMISWTPEGGRSADLQLADIITGTHDTYITQFAAEAKRWGHPFFLRIMHEMNGSWGYNWQEGSNSNKPGEFKQAWRHIVDLLNSEGVTNATYVWCPNIAYSNTVPTFADVYPGDDYVDWTCLDGYNWGTNRSSGWESFETVFDWSYHEVLTLAPNKPMMLGEFGSVEQGGDKGAWFTDALSTQIPHNYKQIRAIVYYNRQADGVDWRIETTTESANAWRAGIAAPYYRANEFGDLSASPIMPLP